MYDNEDYRRSRNPKDQDAHSKQVDHTNDDTSASSKTKESAAATAQRQHDQSLREQQDD